MRSTVGSPPAARQPRPMGHRGRRGAPVGGIVQRLDGGEEHQVSAAHRIAAARQPSAVRIKTESIIGGGNA